MRARLPNSKSARVKGLDFFIRMDEKKNQLPASSVALAYSAPAASVAMPAVTVVPVRPSQSTAGPFGPSAAAAVDLRSLRA